MYNSNFLSAMKYYSTKDTKAGTDPDARPNSRISLSKKQRSGTKSDSGNKTEPVHKPVTVKSEKQDLKENADGYAVVFKDDITDESGNKSKENSSKGNVQVVLADREKLKEAIIWSEILGKPVCKKGKRRESWRLR